MRRDLEFEQFVAERRRALVGFAYALVGDFSTAEDIAAEALARAWTSRRLRQVDQLEHYVRRVIVNLVIGRQRRADIDRRYLPSRRGDWRIADVERGDYDERFVANDDIVKALSQLPFDQRIAIVLRFVFDLSEAETARFLGVPRGTVKSRVARGMTALRRLLTDDEGVLSPPGRGGVVTATTMTSPIASRRERRDRREQAFERFVSERRRALVGFAYALVGDATTADDLAADAVAKVWTSLRRRHIDQLEYYARRVIVNLVIARQRRAKVERRHQPTQRGDWRIATEDHAFDDRLIQRDDLVEALASLPVDQRTTIVLRYVYDLSEDEIAAWMGVAPGTVKSHAARGMATLRVTLAQDDSPESTNDGTR